MSSMEVLKKEYQEVLKAWMFNPTLFIKQTIKLDGIRGTNRLLTRQQEELCMHMGKLVQAKIKKGTGGVLTEEEKWYANKIGISVMSGKGTGKDGISAMLLLWFLYCFYESRILATAPTSKQLKDVFWMEVAKWLNRSEYLQQYIVWESEKVFWKDYRNWFAVPRTIKYDGGNESIAETLQGRHSEYMLYIIDEASAVPDLVFNALEDSMTQLCNIALVIFNPTRSTGYAIYTQSKKGANDWIQLRWNSENSELVTKDSIEKKLAKYGSKDHNLYRISVLGLPPKMNQDSLIPFDWIDRARGLELYVDEYYPVVMGIDSGAGGDESVIYIRWGGKWVDMVAFTEADTMKFAEIVAMKINKFMPDYIVIETIGVGQGVYDRLRQLGYKNIYKFIPHAESRQPLKFKDLRSELWWRLREKFENMEIELPLDCEELIEQLDMMKYEISSGKIEVISKKQLRYKYHASPDRGDAMMMTMLFDNVLFRNEKVRDIDIYERAREKLRKEKEKLSYSINNTWLAI